MNKKILLVVALVVIVLIAAGAYFISKDDDTANQEASTQSTTNETQSEQSNTPTFSPLPTNDESFEAKLSGTTAGDKKIDAVILFDGTGNAKYTGETAGNSFEAYLVDGSYVACASGMCYKVNNDSSKVIDTDQFSYDQADYDSFKSQATYKGKDGCPAGTCDKWEIAEKNSTITIWLDSKNRVSKLETQSYDGVFTYTYEYKDVTIVLPKNIQTLPSTR